MRKKGEIDPVDQYQESLPPAERLAVQQYRQLVAAAQELWRVIYACTTYKEWEEDGSQGVGSCYISEVVADQSVYLPALHVMRQQRNRKTPGKSAIYTYEPLSGSSVQSWSACAYHRANIGCVLEDLKGPLCISYIAPGLYAEIKQDYGADVAQQLTAMMYKLEVTLILLQDQTKPERQREFALRTALADITKLQVHFERIR